MAKAKEIVIVMEDDTVFHYSDCDNMRIELDQSEHFVVKNHKLTSEGIINGCATIKFDCKGFRIICPRGRQKPSMTWQTTYEPVRSVVIE